MKGAERLRMKVCVSYQHVSNSGPALFHTDSVTLLWTYLVLACSLLGEGEDGRYAHGHMVATNIVELCVLNQLPYLRLLQVVQLVQVGSGEVGAERAIVSGDNDTAAAGRRLVVVAVFGADASFGADVLEDLAVLVFADAADVDCGIRWENVLIRQILAFRF
jgi:hypothetical protein